LYAVAVARHHATFTQQNVALPFIQVWANNATLRFTWKRSDGIGDTLYLEKKVDQRERFELRSIPRVSYDVKVWSLLSDGSADLVHEWKNERSGFGVELGALQGNLSAGAAWASVEGTTSFPLLVTDQFPYLVVYDGTGTIQYVDDACGGPAERYNGEIVCLSSDGATTPGLFRAHTQSATAQAQGYFDHESHVDGNQPQYALSFTAYSQSGSRGMIKTEGIAAWNRFQGQVYPLFSLFNFFDPTRDWGAMSTNEDWTHANGVRLGTQNNFIISARHLSAVLSVGYSTGAKQWVLSSEVSSSFNIVGGVCKSGSGRFYNQHHAQQLSSGNIILFDNGNSRPDSEGGKYTRALEFELSSGTATPVWEFVTGEYSFHAGSIQKMSNGNYIVGESCDGEREGTLTGCNAVAWEVDPSGNAVAKVVTPKAQEGPGAYRTQVWSGIFGEGVWDEEKQTPRHLQEESYRLKVEQQSPATNDVYPNYPRQKQLYGAGTFESPASAFAGVGF
jgi:hypothetical protein